MADKLMKVIACLIFVAGFATFAHAETIGYWQFNEKAPGQQADATAGAIIDSSGNAHHGTAKGDVLPSYALGPNDPTSSLHLTYGTHDYVEVPDSADFNLMLGDLQDYTIEAFVKMSSGPANPAFMTKRGSSGAGWSWGTTHTSAGPVMNLYFEVPGSAVYGKCANNFKVTFDEWHHVAIVIDANADPNLTSATFYVDYLSVGTKYFAQSLYAGVWNNNNLVNTVNPWIGDAMYRANDQYGFNGDIDALRFSTGALTPDEFMVPVPEPGTIALLLGGLAGLMLWRRR